MHDALLKLRLPGHLRARLVAAAEAEGESVSVVARRALDRHLPRPMTDPIEAAQRVVDAFEAAEADRTAHLAAMAEHPQPAAGPSDFADDLTRTFSVLDRLTMRA